MTTETTTPVRRRGGPTKGDQREAQILEATRALLAERSAADLTVDAIAKAAGVTRTAFYFYFPTKHAVVAALLAELWDDFGASHAWFASEGPDRAGLREQHRIVAEVWRRHREILVCARGSVDYEPVLEWAARLRDRFEAGLGAKVERDRVAGLAPDGIAAASLAAMVWDVRDARFRAMSDLAPDDLDRALDELTEVVLRMLYGTAPAA